jgi:hypothetical protein
MMSVSLLNILISIPRLFREVTEAICLDPVVQLTTSMDLISRTQRVRLALQAWYFDYIGPPPNGGPKFSKENYKIMILFYITSIYANRMSTCIYWNGTPGIKELEEETQRFAHIIVSLYKEEAYRELQSCLLLAQKLPIAEATIQIGDEWMEQLNSFTSPNNLFMMPEQTFRHWCNLFGRKTS